MLLWTPLVDVSSDLFRPNLAILPLDLWGGLFDLALSQPSQQGSLTRLRSLTNWSGLSTRNQSAVIEFNPMGRRGCPMMG